MLGRNAIKFMHVPLGLVSEIFDPIDVSMFIRKQL